MIHVISKAKVKSYNEIEWKATLTDENDNPVYHLYRKEKAKTKQDIENDLSALIEYYNHDMFNSNRRHIDGYRYSIISGTLLPSARTKELSIKGKKINERPRQVKRNRRVKK